MKAIRQSWHPKGSAPGFLYRHVIFNMGPLDMYVSHAGFHGQRYWGFEVNVFVGDRRLFHFERF